MSGTEATPDALPLALVVAVARTGVIGDAGGMPWHLPEDLRHFKRVTMGHAMVMGRKTYASIGRPLPGRRTIVLTRQPQARFEGCDVAHSLADAVAMARAGGDPEPRVVGGGAVYAEALPLATRLFLTEVQLDVDGDTRFPPFDREAWREVARAEGDRAIYLELERV